jgi:hypothetical protein
LLDITGAHTRDAVVKEWSREVRRGGNDVPMSLHTTATREECVGFTEDLTEMAPFERAVVEDFAAHVLSTYPVAVPA